MSSISHTLLCIVLTLVLCSISSVSAIDVVDSKNIVAVTGPTGTPCIPDEISIQGTTNYNTDNRIIVEISFVGLISENEGAPDRFNGAVETVPVQQGVGVYFWQMSASTSGWDPGMYLIQATVTGKDLIASEFITLERCSDITQTSFSLPSIRTQIAAGSKTTGTPVTTPAVPVMTPATPATPVATVTKVQSNMDYTTTEVPVSATEPQSTPRSPSWFGLAVLACLGAFLLRKI